MNTQLTSMMTILVITSMMSAFFLRKQLLMTMLSMELIMLSIFMLMMNMYWLMNLPVSTPFYILVMSACEASIGLSMLINMTRFKGNDKLSKINLVKC
nr:NADH dehydrogenase subunit 4L [Discoporella cookae]